MAAKRALSRFAILSAVVGLTVGLAGCGGVMNDIEHCFVTGRVIDVGTGLGVIGATVVVGDEAGPTGALGDFAVKAHRGWRLVEVRMDGYNMPGDPLYVNLDGSRLDIGELGVVPDSGNPPDGPAL